MKTNLSADWRRPARRSTPPGISGSPGGGPLYDISDCLRFARTDRNPRPSEKVTAFSGVQLPQRICRRMHHRRRLTQYLDALGLRTGLLRSSTRHGRGAAPFARLQRRVGFWSQGNDRRSRARWGAFDYQGGRPRSSRHRPGESDLALAATEAQILPNIVGRHIRDIPRTTRVRRHHQLVDWVRDAGIRRRSPRPCPPCQSKSSTRVFARRQRGRRKACKLKVLTRD